MTGRRAIRALLGLALGLAAPSGCEGGLTDAAPATSLDEAYFRCHVQPILTKSCAQYACHGDPTRPLRIYARNRLRYGISGEEARNSPLNDRERHLNFESAVGFVDAADPDRSPLLRKPLAESLGGFYHGATKLGASNIFTSATDPDLDPLREWVRGAREKDQQCVEPNSL